jgi:serine/threonine protein kinase
MSRKDNIKKLIVNFERRLQKLREQQALEGRTLDPKILIEIEDIKTAIEELQTDLKALENNGVNEETLRVTSELAEDITHKRRVTIYIKDDISSLSADRQSAAIDSFAGAMGISRQEIEVYRVYPGSIVFDLGIPPYSVQYLRSRLKSNSAQLRLLKVEKVILERGSGETEEWVIEEGKYNLVTSTQSTVFSGVHGKSQRTTYEEHLLLEDKNMLEPGKILFNKYEILEFIGEGAYASVFKAKQLDLPRLVAIKSLKPKWIENQVELERFLREAEIVAQISNPNILEIFDFGREPETNSYLIITEFSERGSLERWLKNSLNDISIDDVLQVAICICNGLEAIHSKGVVHRDVKPGNVLLFGGHEKQYLSKLSDFGLAGVLPNPYGSIPPGLQVYGTLRYMSPEQLDPDKEVDHRADLYSLGIILYELLTGRVPFDDEGDGLFWAHMFVAPPSPREINPHIPEELEQVVMLALRKNPEDRYQTAADMREAIEAIQFESVRLKREARFDKFLKKGLDQLQAGRYEQAIGLLMQAKILQPGNEKLQKALQIALEKQRLERLYESARRSIEKNEWEEAREYLAEIFSREPTYASGQVKEQLDRIEKELEQKRHRDDLQLHYHLGVGHLLAEQWSQAIRHLKYVVAQDHSYKDAADRLKEARNKRLQHIATTLMDRWKVQYRSMNANVRVFVIILLLVIVGVGGIGILFSGQVPPPLAEVSPPPTSILTPTVLPATIPIAMPTITLTVTPSPVNTVMQTPTKRPTAIPASINTPTHTLSFTPTPVNGVATGDVYIREGPSINYPVVDGLRKGNEIFILGTNPSRNWFKIAGPNVTTGWVIARYIETSGPLQDLPLLLAQPRPPTPVFDIDQPLDFPEEIAIGGPSILGQINPGTEQWYTFIVDQPSSTIMLMFKPNENFLADSFIGYKVRFALYTAQVVSAWPPENVERLDHIGLGLNPTADRDGDLGTGELIWTGPLTRRARFYLRIVNESNKTIELCLATENTYEWTCE